METHPLTPKQVELLNSPAAQMLIEKFDLQVIPSPEFLKNQKMQQHIDELFRKLDGETQKYQAYRPHTPESPMGNPKPTTEGAGF